MTFRRKRRRPRGYAGQQIARHRQVHNLSQAQLAALAGVSVEWVARREDGVRLTPGEVALLVRAGLSPEGLIASAVDDFEADVRGAVGRVNLDGRAD